MKGTSGSRAASVDAPGEGGQAGRLGKAGELQEQGSDHLGTFTKLPDGDWEREGRAGKGTLENSGWVRDPQRTGSMFVLPGVKLNSKNQLFLLGRVHWN